MHDEAIRTFLLRDHGRVVRAKDRQVDDLTGWVVTAAINRARSRWRTQAAERRAFDRLAATTERRLRAHPADGDVPVVFDEQVAETLRNLPRSQRMVVALHYLIDMPVADVAAHLGLAEGTVKTHLHRARETMRAALEEQPEPTTATSEVPHA